MRRLTAIKYATAMMIALIMMVGSASAKSVYERNMERERKEAIRTERRLIQRIGEADKRQRRSAAKPRRSRMTREAKKRIRELEKQQRDAIKEKASRAIARQRLYQVQGEGH